MTYRFKVVEKKWGRISDYISITSSASLGFPTVFYEIHKISTYKYVVLYYDKELRALGIQFVNDGEKKNMIKIAHSKKYGGQISLKNFLKIYDLDANIYKGRYEYKEIEDENIGKLFVIELKENEK